VTHSASYVQAFPNYRIRQTAQASQPRYVVAKRLNSVRMNWFMLGTLSGMALCFTFNAITGSLFTSSHNAEYRTASLIPDVTLETAASDPTSASQSIAKLAHSSKERITSFIIGDDEMTFDAGGEAEMTLTAADAASEDKMTLAEQSYPKTITHQLKKGETLTNVLTDNDIGYQHAHNAITSLRKTFNPRSLREGQELTLTLDQTDNGEVVLSELQIKKNTIESVVLERSDDGSFNAEQAKKALQPELTLAGGTIVSSLFETGYANGIPDGVLAELMQAYSYDVDFQREIQRGDQIEVLFEKMKTEDGEAAGYGNILYATLKLRGKPISIYHYASQDGRSGFYNEKGESVIKALLKTPVNGARISSGFGKRKHPILGYSKMHTGTDFAAATGTPIYASGEGVITFAGTKGGYGNYIQIKHNGTYSSAYAHMHRFASGMRPGKAVKQGQVIGYVGSTGRSTGPHLHYEVIKNGHKVNPMGEKFQTGKILKGTELANFKANIGKLKQQIASMPRNQTTVASAQ